jgi:hypothetical protein
MSFDFSEKRNRDTHRFSEEYKQELFLVWYENNRPNARNFMAIVPEDKFGHKPPRTTIEGWIYKDFKPKAEIVDQDVRERVSDQLVKEKVEMLQRHIQISRSMQDTAIKYLEQHENDLSPHIAVRLLVEGIRIERESVGIPNVLLKMSEMSDEDLVKKVEELIERSPVEILPAEIEDAEI